MNHSILVALLILAVFAFVVTMMVCDLDDLIGDEREAAEEAGPGGVAAPSPPSGAASTIAPVGASDPRPVLTLTGGPDETA